MDNFVISVIRTVVPSFIGTALLFMSRYGISVDQAGATALTAGVIALSIGLYYAAVRLIAQRYPKFEILLGSLNKPTYEIQK